MSQPSAIQREIRQTRPFASREEEAVVALARTADLMKRALGRVVEPYAITLQQYNVLRILRGAGESGLPTLEIGARMIEHAPGVTRLVERLEGKALVHRERCARDRRQVLCWITPAGRQTVDALDAAINDAARAFMGTLGPARLASLVDCLDRLRDGR